MKKASLEELRTMLCEAISSPTKSGEKEAFIQEYILLPLFNKIGTQTDIFYFAHQKQSLSILVNEPIKSSLAQQYLDLFENDSSDYWFFTSEGIIFFNIITFLQTGEITWYLYTELEYICLGRYFASLKITANNNPAIGIFSCKQTYSWAMISEKDLQQLSKILDSYEPAHKILHFLTDSGLLGFVKQWQKGRVS